MSNIHQKITELKLELSSVEIKKSGHNKHLGFKYHELADFLGVISQLNAKHGISENISIDNEIATLTLTNVDEPTDKIEVKVPTVFADMQPKNDSIQKLGATLTYLRRYLYVQAYAITEHDVVDALNLKEVKVDNTTQAKKLFGYIKSKAKDETQANMLALGFVKDFLGYESMSKIDFSTTSLKDLLTEFDNFYQNTVGGQS